MTRPESSERVLRRVKRAYEGAHVLHRTTQATWLVAAALAATLATLGWRGGAWRRGALAGTAAGLPVFVAPALYFMITQGSHCPDCAMQPSLTCMLVCLGTSALVGVAVGHAATRDPSPPRFGSGAIASALLAGLLGCGTIGVAGAIGVAIGLVAGGVTGWVVARRPVSA
jgi:hypothetical protein